jgi:hypothetical protein
VSVEVKSSVVVKVGVKVVVKVGLKVGEGVGESREELVKAEGVNGCIMGEEVGVKVGVGEGAEVEVEFEEAILLPSASESEKPPRSKPTEARAMMIPRNTCRKLLTASSLRATLPRPVSGH